MTRIFGNKWTSVAESDDGTWLDGLRGLTPSQLGDGFKKLILSGHTWPPSLPEFRMMCVDIDEEALEFYVRKRAFQGYDSYYVGQMTQKDQDFHIKRVRAEATADFYRLVVSSTAAEAVLALEDQS